MNRPNASCVCTTMLLGEVSSSRRGIAASLFVLAAGFVAYEPIRTIDTPNVPPPPSPAVAPVTVTPITPVTVEPIRHEVPVYAYNAAVDRDFLYWTQSSGNEHAVAALWRAPLDGGGTEQLAGSAGYSLLVTDTDVIYTDNMGYAIRAKSKADGTDRLLAATSSEPLEITLGGGYVYWTGWNRTVHRVPLAGGAKQDLRVGSQSDPIIADDNYLFIASVKTGKLLRVSHATREVKTLAGGFQGASNVVAVNDSVFVTAGRNLYKVPVTGGEPALLGTAGEAHRLVENGSFLYWTTWADPTIATTDGCEGFQRGVVRLVDTNTGGMELVEADCGVRGVAAGSQVVYQIEHDRVVRTR